MLLLSAIFRFASICRWLAAYSSRSVCMALDPIGESHVLGEAQWFIFNYIWLITAILFLLVNFFASVRRDLSQFLSLSISSWVCVCSCWSRCVCTPNCGPG